jgi:hypothetical protein
LITVSGNAVATPSAGDTVTLAEAFHEYGVSARHDQGIML